MNEAKTDTDIPPLVHITITVPKGMHLTKAQVEAIARNELGLETVLLTPAKPPDPTAD